METYIDRSLIKRVEDSLDTIRPYLAADGGDIKVISISNQFVLKLKLLGNCADCAMSYMTMKAGVEDAVRKAVPEILRVETI